MTSWTEADALATTKPPPPHGALKQCSRCAATFTVDEWLDLELVGYMTYDQETLLELRNCGCGSTISRRVRRPR